MADSVLLIDDDADVLRAVGNYFERLGYEVRRELSGEAGLQTWDRFRPDVTVLDLGLPGMDGLQVLEHLRQWTTSADEWQELVAVTQQIGLQENPEPSTYVRAAELLESVAARIEGSGLVRAVSTQDPAVLREQAAAYRAGRDPHAEVPQ